MLTDGSIEKWWEEYQNKENQRSLKEGCFSKRWWVFCPYCGEKQWNWDMPPEADSWTIRHCNACDKSYHLKWEHLFSTKTIDCNIVKEAGDDPVSF